MKKLTVINVNIIIIDGDSDKWLVVFDQGKRAAKIYKNNILVNTYNQLGGQANKTTALRIVRKIIEQ